MLSRPDAITLDNRIVMRSVAALLTLSHAAALQVGMTMRAPRTAAVRMEAPAAEPAVAAVPETAPAPTGYVPPAWTGDVVGVPMDVSKWTTDERLTKVVKRAEFWTNESATVLEIVNIIGRWNSHLDFKERSVFTEESYKDESLSQGATEKRHQMALKLGVTERIGLQQNIPNRPFTNEKLAASFGMTCADFEDIPVTVDACNVAYDALAESRSGLIPYADADKRRNEWLNDDGSFNQPRFLTGLAKSRFTVIIAWFIFGKGNFVWVLVFVQALHDVRPDIFPTPKEAGLDKIGFFT